MDLDSKASTGSAASTPSWKIQDSDDDQGSLRSLDLDDKPIGLNAIKLNNTENEIANAKESDTSKPKQESSSQASHAVESSTYHQSVSRDTPSLPVPPVAQITSSPESSRFKDLESETQSISSESQKKLRPDSIVIPLTKDPLILGIALVDFDHSVGPRIEFSRGKLLEEDEEIAKILPFLALPDGAHLSSEDYSYFHLVPSKPGSATVFGISCNRQISSSELLVKGEEVTRSTVQKALVVLASKPVFGPIRDKLGVVTRAYFNQRDFSETEILDQFFETLESSLRTQLTESGFYMGTSLRELVHAFRHRTLTLLKGLILQRKIMFYGHPVEKLCTYQYSLVSLIPGLLQTLEDCGSPTLAARAPTLSKPSELRTSDRKSMFAFMGLPLDLFGKGAFFQPYLPLQQIDMLKAPSALCGSTNSIVTQQKDLDMLVNIETSQIEFRTPHVEKLVALTPADRKWIDDIVRDVNSSWNENDPTRPLDMQFKGSDDYLRTKFEEYIASALSTVKYHEYSKRDGRSVLVPGEAGASSWSDYGDAFLSSFQMTPAYEIWNRITDPILFDIIEPKHPCEDKPTIVADIGLRLQENINELHLDQLGPSRETLNSALAAGSSALTVGSNALAAGSTSFLKAVEGVRGNVTRMVAQRKASSSASSVNSPTSSIEATSPPPPSSYSGTERDPKLRPLSLASVASIASASSVATRSENAPTSRPTFSAWGSNIGSFITSRASKLRESVSSMASVEAQQAPPPVPVKEMILVPTTGEKQFSNPSSPLPSASSAGRSSRPGSKDLANTMKMELRTNNIGDESPSTARPLSKINTSAPKEAQVPVVTTEMNDSTEKS